MLKKIAGLFGLVCLVVLLSTCAAPVEEERETVRIAMPESSGMLDAETNTYKCWLEEQSGLRIELELIPTGYMAEYLRLLFAGRTEAVDAVFFDPMSAAISLEELSQWGEAGRILPLETMMQDDTCIGALMRDVTMYDLQQALLAPDGHIYTMPNLQYSAVLKSAQTLWLNIDWMRQTGVSIPQTTEDFRAVLRAFLENDPNADGTQNELPIAFSLDAEPQCIINFLMNAFVYCDPDNSYMAVENGEVYFAPMTAQWREGLLYCRELYEEGLLPEACLSFNEAQLVRAVNDPRGLVGGFTTSDIADIVPQSSPEIMSMYTHIAPLAGPDGTRYAWIKTEQPSPGGVVLSDCEHPEAVFALMDLMLSEEAYLIAAFGEQGVDWNYSNISEVGLSGGAAKITIINQEWATPQNKNFAGMGPFVTYPEYADNVAWSGYQSDQQYLNARAARVYLEYEPEEYIPAQRVQERLRPVKTRIGAYTKDMMLAFLTGQADIRDDAAWQAYLDGYTELGIDSLLLATQAFYTLVREGGGT